MARKNLEMKVVALGARAKNMSGQSKRITGSEGTSDLVDPGNAGHIPGLSNLALHLIRFPSLV